MTHQREYGRTAIRIDQAVWDPTPADPWLKRIRIQALNQMRYSLSQAENTQRQRNKRQERADEFRFKRLREINADQPEEL